MPLIKQYRSLLVLCIIIVLAQLFTDAGNQHLIYQRTEILNGQWWRLLSTHFVHLSWTHLIMNLTGLILIRMIADNSLSEKQWLLALTSGSILTSLMLLTFSPELMWYVGLSGVLHGLLIVTAIMQIRSGQRTGWIILIFVIGKVTWEQWAGPSLSLEESIGGNVIINAHLYGAIAGALVSVSLMVFNRNRTKKISQNRT